MSEQRHPVVMAQAPGIEFTPEQIDRLGHWLSECLDDAAPLNERLWRGRAEWMVKGPTFQQVLREVCAHSSTRPANTRSATLPPLHGGYMPRAEASRPKVTPPIPPAGSGAGSLTRAAGAIEALVTAAMRAVLDPGSVVERGADREGTAYGEPINDWQRRALRESLTPLVAGFVQPEDVAEAKAKACRHMEAPGTMWGRLRKAEEQAEYRAELLRAVVSHVDVNHADLPLTLLDSIRADLGGPR